MTEMRKLTPLMDGLMHWFGARLADSRDLHHSRVRLQTFTGLIDRGLITPLRFSGYDDDGFTRSEHAVTTDGLLWLLKNSASADVRHAVKRQLVIDAAHCFALAELAADPHGKSYDLWFEARTIMSLRLGDQAPFPMHQGPRPVLCRQSSTPASHADHSADQLCALPLDHDGNHSWAPADLAPSSLKVQREALAADYEHAAKTAPHERYGADPRWTHVDDGTFQVAGGEGALDVTARAVRDIPGRFTLHFLGRDVATVEYDEASKTWQPVR